MTRTIIPTSTSGLPHDHAEARVAAAIAAGGHLVNDENAPGWWTLADAEGNEVDVASWPDRDRSRYEWVRPRCQITDPVVQLAHIRSVEPHRREGVRMAAESRAHARWHGDLMTGAGTIDRVGSGTFGPLDVTWAARTGEGSGTSTPEELLAAAHAACYSMALSNILAEQGTPPTELSTSVTVTFVAGTGITTSKIEVEGQVPGIDEASFQRAAEEAKDGCPVSKALHGNVELSVVARLVG